MRKLTAFDLILCAYMFGLTAAACWLSVRWAQ